MDWGRRIASLAALAVISLPYLAQEQTPAAADPGGVGAARCWRFAISGDSSEAWIPSSNRHSVWRVSLADGKILKRARMHGIVSAIDLSPDGTVLASAIGNRDRVVLSDPATLAPGAEIPTGRKPRLLDFGDEGTDLCVLCPRDNEADLIDIPGQHLEKIIPLPSRPACFAHYSGGTVVSLPNDGVLIILEPVTHDIIATVPISPVPNWIARAGQADGRPRHVGGSPPVGHEGDNHTFRTISSVTGTSSSGGGGGSTKVPATEVLIATARESDSVTILDGATLDVLAVVPVEAPGMVEAGCCASPVAYVLHENGKSLAVIDVDVLSPTFAQVLYTVRFGEPAEAIAVAGNGRCYALSVSHHRLYMIDPAQPSDVPNEILRLKLRSHDDDD